MKPAKPADPETWKVTRVGGAEPYRRPDGDGRSAEQARGDQGRVVRRRQDEDRPRQAGAGRQRQLRRGQVRARALRPGRRRRPSASRDGEAGDREDRHVVDARRDAGVRRRGDAEGAGAGSERRARRSEQPGAAFARRDVALAVVRQRLRAEDRSAARPPAAAAANPRPTNNCAATCSGIFSDSRRRPRLLVGVGAIAQAAARRCTASMPSRMQTPASNQKLITSAVAADRLGWDYRYTTKHLRDRAALVRRRSRRRSRGRVERRSDDQPAASGSLGRVRCVGQAALREGHPARRRAADRRRQRVCRAGLGLRLGVGRPRPRLRRRRSARCNTTRTRSSC